jgi:uncharacterized membrane protein
MADSAKQPGPVAQGKPSENDHLVKQFEQMLEASAPDAFKQVPAKLRPALFRASIQFSQSVVRQGPIPDPEDLARYNVIIPDGANRIMKMAEDQAKHRIAIESTVIDSQQVQGKRGQLFGLAIAVIGIGAGAYLTMNGHDAVGAVIGGTTVVSLAIAFITGRRVQQKELQEKRSG